MQPFAWTVEDIETERIAAAMRIRVALVSPVSTTSPIPTLSSNRANHPRTLTEGRGHTHCGIICELKKQVRIGLVLRGEVQPAISDRARVAHGTQISPDRQALQDAVSGRSARCCLHRRGEPDQPLVNASCDVGLALRPLPPATTPSERRPNRNPLRMNGIRLRVAEIVS